MLCHFYLVRWNFPHILRGPNWTLTLKLFVSSESDLWSTIVDSYQYLNTRFTSIVKRFQLKSTICFSIYLSPRAFATVSVKSNNYLHSLFSISSPWLEATLSKRKSPSADLLTTILLILTIGTVHFAIAAVDRVDAGAVAVELVGKTS